MMKLLNTCHGKKNNGSIVYRLGRYPQRTSNPYKVERGVQFSLDPQFFIQLLFFLRTNDVNDRPGRSLRQSGELILDERDRRGAEVSEAECKENRKHNENEEADDCRKKLRHNF